MLSKNHRQEAMSRAYIQAIAGRCGFSCAFRDFDYGIDVTVREVAERRGRLVESGFGIDIQAKSSAAATIENGWLVHDLEVKNYNDLCEPAVGSARILVLLLLPQDEGEWIGFSEESLILRRCSYWLSLKGSAPSENLSTVRIRIPTTNTFSVEALAELMRRVREGENL